MMATLYVGYSGAATMQLGQETSYCGKRLKDIGLGLQRPSQASPLPLSSAQVLWALGLVAAPARCTQYLLYFTGGVLSRGTFLSDDPIKQPDLSCSDLWVLGYGCGREGT